MREIACSVGKTDKITDNNILKKYFTSMDIHFGNYISNFTGENKEELFLAAALVSRYVNEGHICLDLNDMAGKIIFRSDDGKNIVQCPQLERWLPFLKKASCVGEPGDFKPLIINAKNRLYLHRYWQYEKDVAEYISATVFKVNEIKIDKTELQEKLRIYFDEKSDQETNWQKVAAVAALLNNFLVISGSPGSGKTTVITKIMALILEMGDRRSRIALAAPTGKAAARLQESVNKTKEELNCPESIKEIIPGEAQTIHRLLGSVINSPYFRFNKGNLLPYDFVVIDEASMVDLPLMAKLIAALPASACLILLGDKDQLASVEAGVVLGDICSQASPNIFSAEFASQIYSLSGEKIESGNLPAGLQDNIVHLRKNYRFSERSGVGLLSQAVKNGESRDALELLRAKQYSEIHWTELKGSTKLLKKFGETVIEDYKEYLKAATSGSSGLENIFNLFERFRILCALRMGNWGAERINYHVEDVLRASGMIKTRDIFYEGMPVMILQNDYRLRLFNGDVGIVLKDREDDNQLRAFFRDEQNAVRKYSISRLPQYEKAWAMTVHKSQGSEFEKVLLVLSDRDVPLITRELIYTGITRARGSVDIWAGEELLKKAISRGIARQSGLTDTLFRHKVQP